MIDKENKELFQIVQGALNLQMETKRKFKSVAHPYFPNMECADHYLDGGVYKWARVKHDIIFTLLGWMYFYTLQI